MTQVVEGAQPIVVGVDGSQGSLRALRWALEEARARRTRVEAVMAWEPAVGVWASPMGAVPIELFSRQDFEADTERELADVVMPVAHEYPEVQVSCAAVEGQPSNALIGRADRDDAALLVVGSRGQGGFARLLLGSVSEQCATHAHCPVTVVR